MAPPAASVWPWYGVLAVAIAAMSWGGPFFALLAPTPPMLKAGHRLVVTSLMMIPGFVWDWRAADAALRARWKRAWRPLALSGVTIGLHFVAFSFSVDHTSFSNAMLICSITPVLLVLWAIALWAAVRLFRRLHGAAIDADVQRHGDAPVAATSAAAAMASSVPAATTACDAEAAAAASTLSPRGDEEADRLVLVQRSLEWQAVEPVGTGGGAAAVPQPPGCLDHMPLRTLGEPGTPVVCDARLHSPVASGVNPPIPPPRPSPPPPPLHWTTALMTSLTGQPVPQAMAPLFPTIQEMVGSVVAFVGVCYLAVAREAEATAASAAIRPRGSDGDAAGFVTACFMAGYLVIGSRLRSWMPLWLYTLPVTALGAVVACACAVAIEGHVSPSNPPVTLAGVTPYSLFGWLGSPRAFGLTMGIAFVPGIMGHTLANLSLARIPPLVLSVAQLVQPPISAFWGYLIGVQGQPSTSTFVAAPIIITGIALVITGSRKAIEAGFGLAALVGRCRKVASGV